MLKRRFGITEIALFCSRVTGRARKSSDLDVLVSFKAGFKTFNNYMDLKFYLEDLLGGKVDLVVKEVLREEIWREVMETCVNV